MTKKPSYEELEQRVKELERQLFELKHSENELKQSEEKYRTLVENVDVGITIIDPDHNIVMTNSTVGKWFDKSPSKLIGKKCYEEFEKKEEPCSSCPGIEAMATGQPCEVETQGVRDDGTRFTVKEKAFPFYNIDGELIGFHEIVEDISVRKAAEKALQESEGSLAMAQEVADIGSWDLKIKDDTLTWSDKTYRQFGLKPGEITPTYEAFEGFVHPDDLEFTNQSVEQALNEDKPYSVDVRMIRKDGTEWIMHAQGEVYRDKDGKAIRFIGTQQDITERKKLEEALSKHRDHLENLVEERTAELTKANEQLKKEIEERKRAQKALRDSEERYRMLFNNVKDAVYVYHPKTRNLVGKIIEVNDAACQRYGYTREQFSGLTALDLAAPEEIDKAAGRVERLFAEKHILLDTLHVTKDGRRIPTETHSHLFEFKEKPTILSIARDVTERKLAEEEKEKLQAQLLESKKMEAIATLAGGIAHEFNNTLVGITGHIDLLQMDPPDNENVSKYTERMKASALHMAHLTDQLLAYARGGKYQPKNISISDFVEETLPLIKHTIDPSIRIEMDLPHDILNIEADLTQMQMVLSAILNNSAEAIEEKGRIRIITKNEEVKKGFAKNHPDLKPGPYVCLTVEDDGKGMEEETRAKIFDPFFTTKFQGRGLGMAAVYGIVTNHGGWISVDSQLGKGTVVRIYLPAVKVQVKEEERPRIEPTKGTGTILVIEDEDIVIDVICAMVERLGYRVLLAETGKKAVNIAKGFGGDIDLAILDILLPDLAAKEVYRDIMEARPDLKVIVCSGYAIDGPPQEILDAGAQDFIQKPFSYATLSEKLKEVLEGK